MVKKKNYDKFIFKGSLALESYLDVTNDNIKLIEMFNKKLKNYRFNKNNKDEEKKIIVDSLLSLIKKIGEENFAIYDDGDIEYIGNNKKGVDFDVK